MCIIKYLQLLIFLYLLYAVSGCAIKPPTVSEQVNLDLPADLNQHGQYYWWYARFRINWPENTRPDFSIDTLIADAVIEPILMEHQNNISLWRFHRRANRDNTGHQFSFIFYSSRTTAEKIFNKIKNDQITKKLLTQNIVKNVVTDNPENNIRSQLKDTSDKNWSSTLQTAWPVFIMGVSATWLQLINQQINQSSINDELDELLITYRDVNQKVNSIWHKEGQHAFFHHLNALFGYEPIRIEQSIRY